MRPDSSRLLYVLLAVAVLFLAVVASFGIPLTHWLIDRSYEDAAPVETEEPRTVRVGDQVIVGDVTVIRWEDVYAEGDLDNAWAIAVDHGDVEKVKILLEDGVDPDTPLRPGRTALIKASWLGYTELVRELLAEGADPMAREEDTIGREGFLGSTALHEAAYKGHLEIMEMLLAGGVPVDVKAGDEHGYRTPLASAIGDFEAFSYLLERGAKLEEAGEAGLLLDSAASRNSLDVARYLLEAGAPVEGVPGKAEYGYTALWSAISGSSDRGRYEMVKLLLEHGADPERKMYGGQTLLELAREKEQERVVALMERAVRGEPLELPVEAPPEE